MSTALITICKDEIDIIEPFLRHSAGHVDVIYVADQNSTDGTREKLAELAQEMPLIVSDLEEQGYWQSKFMTNLARRAFADKHSWVVASDCDELWHVSEDSSRRIGDYLDGVAPDVQKITASIFNRIPTATDDQAEENPFKRIVWRKREPGPMPKVCCRTHPTLLIGPGNHTARYSGITLTVPGLAIQHFSWRSAEQYLRKLRNGSAAYAATDLPDDIGVHWRMWDGISDEQIKEHFYVWFWSNQPEKDDSLIYEPAPVLDQKG